MSQYVPGRRDGGTRAVWAVAEGDIITTLVHTAFTGVHAGTVILKERVRECCTMIECRMTMSMIVDSTITQ